MLRYFVLSVIFSLLTVSSLSAGQGRFNISYSPKIIRQGDVINLTIKTRDKLTSLNGNFNGEQIFFNRTREGLFHGILGIDMKLKPGHHELHLTGVTEKGDIKYSSVIKVKGRQYEVERLNFPEKMVELDTETEERAEREAEILKRIWKDVSNERLWDEKFGLPVEGNLRANFGKRRILNGIEKSPHNGVDISAPEGKEIVSPGKGIVVLTDEHFFGGKTIVIDHGQGLFTTYLHLSEISVKQGDIVGRGDLIGRIGESGRSKGPHLHWSARLNNARIDPLNLLDI